MKNVLVLTVLTALVSSPACLAQLASLPPPALDDGLIVRSHAGDPSYATWQTSALNGYRLDSSHPMPPPVADTPDSFGNVWVAHPPSRDELTRSGGTLRVIFLGASDAAPDGVGYSYSGSPSGPNSFTIASRDNSGRGLPDFGDYFDLPLSVHQADNLDLWFATPAAAYALFSPAHSEPTSPVGQILWTQTPLLISTFIPALNDYAAVPTWIANLSEPGTEGGTGINYRVAIQIFPLQGSPLAVPEPSAYGAAATLMLGSAVAHRALHGRKEH